MPKNVRKKVIHIILMAIFSALFGYCLVLVMNAMPIWLFVLLFVCLGIVLALAITAKLMEWESIFKLCAIGLYVGVLFIIIYDIMVYTGFLEQFEDYNQLKEFINNTGGRSEIIFIIVQFMQVTFIPIPSNIVVMVGDELFGPGKAMILSLIGQIFGSMFAFFLGKTFGLKLAHWIAGREAVEKYQKLVKGRDKALLIMMFLFPFFPDDLLCMIAGLTNLGYFSFLVIMLITRPISVGTTILFKRGIFNIPMTGWGIPVWILLIGAMAFVFVYAVKKGDKLELMMFKFMSKITGKDYAGNIYGKPTITDDSIKPPVESNNCVINDNRNSNNKKKSPKKVEIGLDTLETDKKIE